MPRPARRSSRSRSSRDRSNGRMRSRASRTRSAHKRLRRSRSTYRAVRKIIIPWVRLLECVNCVLYQIEIVKRAVENQNDHGRLVRTRHYALIAPGDGSNTVYYSDSLEDQTFWYANNRLIMGEIQLQREYSYEQKSSSYTFYNTETGLLARDVASLKNMKTILFSCLSQKKNVLTYHTSVLTTKGKEIQIESVNGDRGLMCDGNPLLLTT